MTQVHSRHNMQHSGRGGAGNVESIEHTAADDVAEFPPELHGPYSTGRGGAANVKRNDAGPRVARIAQDLEGPDRKEEDHRLLEPSQYSGRGGRGNIEAHRKSQELSRSRGNTPKSGSQTPVGGADGKSHPSGLADKLKHAFGHHKSED